MEEIRRISDSELDVNAGAKSGGIVSIGAALGGGIVPVGAALGGSGVDRIFDGKCANENDIGRDLLPFDDCKALPIDVLAASEVCLHHSAIVVVG